MCTPIRYFKLANIIINNQDNSVYLVNLYTVSADNLVIMFIFLIYSLAWCLGNVSNSNVSMKFVKEWHAQICKIWTELLLWFVWWIDRYALIRLGSSFHSVRWCFSSRNLLKRSEIFNEKFAAYKLDPQREGSKKSLLIKHYFASFLTNARTFLRLKFSKRGSHRKNLIKSMSSTAACINKTFPFGKTKDRILSGRRAI